MPLFRPSLLRYAIPSTSGTRQAAQEVLRARAASTSYPTIPTCPSPSCPCADMPPDLDLERSVDLNGTMAPYAEHLIIPSGQADWTSKIEDEKDTAAWGEFTANVKQALSQKGGFHDPYHNIVVSTTSFTTPSYESTEKASRALLFPSFKLVEKVNTSQRDIPDFIRTFLLPEKLHPSYETLSEEEKQGKRRDITNLTSEHWTGNVYPISSPTILICSHNSRDSRCGILGPLLHAEFTQYVNKRASLLNAASDHTKRGTPKSNSSTSHPDFNPDFVDRKTGQHPINIGMISHIGGHKFAGNVIIYIPPDYPDQGVSEQEDGPGTKSKESVDPKAQGKLLREDEPMDFVSDGLHPLAGKGIWYGRVEPKHVEGIVEQTLGHGKIIRELFRGGVNKDGSSIRLSLY